MGTLGLQVGELTGHGVQDAAFSLTRLGFVKHSIMLRFSFLVMRGYAVRFAGNRFLCIPYWTFASLCVNNASIKASGLAHMPLF